MSKGITRRSFATVAGGTAVAVAAAPLRPGRRAHLQDQHERAGVASLNVHLSKAAEQVKTETGGQFEFHLFPSNQLGADADMLSQLLLRGLGMLPAFRRERAVDAHPVGAITGVGFGFPRTIQTPVERHQRQTRRAPARGDHQGGYLVLDKIWDNGFRLITNSAKPINIRTTSRP